MEETRDVTVHLEMKLGTAFVIGLGFAPAGLLVMLIPWILIFLFVLPVSMVS